MNKYVAILLLLFVSASSANAVADSFDPSTSILTIPSVSVGSATYNNVTIGLVSYQVLGTPPFGFANAAGVANFDSSTSVLTIPNVNVGNTNYTNVTVKLNNYNVLGATQASSVGFVIYEDNLIRINMKGSSRGSPIGVNGPKTVVFSLLITNKAFTRIGIGMEHGAILTLSDEKGTVCAYGDGGTSGGLSSSGLVTIQQLTDVKITDYVILDGGSSWVSGVQSTCSFSGNTFTFHYSSLQVYDEAANTTTQIPFSFSDVAIPN